VTKAVIEIVIVTETMIVAVTDIVIVTMTVTVVVTVDLHLYFMAAGRGKEIGL
jgi:hypothetical protein